MTIRAEHIKVFLWYPSVLGPDYANEFTQLVLWPMATSTAISSWSSENPLCFNFVFFMYPFRLLFYASNFFSRMGVWTTELNLWWKANARLNSSINKLGHTGVKKNSLSKNVKHNYFEICQQFYNPFWCDLQTCQLSCWNTTPAIDVEWMNDQKFLIAEANGVISLDSVNPSKMRKVIIDLNVIF